MLLERHALGLELRHPIAHAALSLVVLVVLVQRQTEKLATSLALRLCVLVTRRVYLPHKLRSGLLECGVHLLDRVAKVVPVALRVSAAKDRHRLTAQVEASDLLQVVVPR